MGAQVEGECGPFERRSRRISYLERRSEEAALTI